MSIVKKLRSYKRCNQRRAELIHKKNRDGLTGAEAKDLQELQTWCLAWVRKRHLPPPPSPELIATNLPFRTSKAK